MKLLEGGNVFKDADGNPLTGRIKQADIPTTVQWIEQVTGLEFPRERWLGSTGRKPDSGDLDLAVDLSEISKEQLAAKLTAWAQSHKLDPKEWVKKGGEVHLRTPITGRPDLGFVQTDFMFFPNLDWGTFFYAGGEDSSYKGMYRNILMSSVAKQLGLKIGSNGVFSRASNEQLTQDADEAARMLLGPKATRENLKNVESIYTALATDKDRAAKVADFEAVLAKDGYQPPTTVQEDEVNFLARLRDRIVNQGMYALIEDRQVRETDSVGGRAKGIEHIEDLVFRKGTAGAQEALQIIAAAAQDTAGTTTAKWDGKPAVVFGRKPDTGEFVLTDGSGFDAKTYDGMFTSPRAIVKDMQRRDDAAAAKGNAATRVETLAPIYTTLWPALEAAFPKTQRGYVKGDLLFYPQQEWRKEAGNAVFQPNEVLYRIPLNSDLGQQIAQSNIGIAMHTMYADQGSAKQPLSGIKFKPVPGLLLIPPISAKSLKPNTELVKQIKQVITQHGAAINTLFNPVELRAQKITDLAKLCVDYINTRVRAGQGFDNLLPGFLEWLQTSVTPSKYNNIVEYLQSPTSNQTGMSAAFTLWILLHDLKMDILQQLDLQHPGQEGWVMATPAGYAKAVSRMPGGFAASNLARNNPR